MLKRDRKWFRVSEIADQCAEIPGSVELDQDKRALALEKLRTAILEGEFNDPKGRSKVACLHSSPVIPIRFHQYGAGMSDDFLKLTHICGSAGRIAQHGFRVKDTSFQKNG
jgi:hypothetical protein